MKPKTAVEETAELATTEPECLVVIETGDPRFDRARKLRDEFKQVFLRSIDAQVMLGGELMALKAELGYNAWGGDRKSRGHCAALIENRRTWEEWCQGELGISERTAQRFINCFKAIQGRAKKLGDDSLQCRLLSTPASELDDGDYKILSQVLRDLIGEQSQTELLKGLKVLRPDRILSGGDTSAARKKNLANLNSVIAAELWKCAFSGLAKAAHLINGFRNRDDLERWIFLLPLVQDGEFPGLLAYRDTLTELIKNSTEDLAAILDLLDRFIDAKKQGDMATMRKAKRQAKHQTNNNR